MTGPPSTRGARRRRTRLLARVVAGCVAATLAHAASAAEPPAPPEPTYPRLAGGMRLSIGALGFDRVGPYAALSGRVGARFGPVLAVYGEATGGGGFFGGTSGANYVAAMQPYAAATLSLRVAPRLELAFGPALGVITPFPRGARGAIVRGGGLARILFPLGRDKPGSTGLQFAPSLEIVAFGGPERPSVAVSAGLAGLEWY